MKIDYIRMDMRITRNVYEGQSNNRLISVAKRVAVATLIPLILIALSELVVKNLIGITALNLGIGMINLGSAAIQKARNLCAAKPPPAPPALPATPEPPPVAVVVPSPHIPAQAPAQPPPQEAPSPPIEAVLSPRLDAAAAPAPEAVPEAAPAAEPAPPPPELPPEAVPAAAAAAAPEPREAEEELPPSSREPAFPSPQHIRRFSSAAQSAFKHLRTRLGQTNWRNWFASKIGDFK